MRKMATNYNELKMNVELNRRDVCDLLIALQVTDDTAKELDPLNNKWRELHDRLESVLDQFDSENKDRLV